MIPNDPEGRVIAWDAQFGNVSLQPWKQRFAVGNPETGVWTNYEITVPNGFGDLFCSGHVWLPNGTLFVAGGNTKYTTTGSPWYEGSQFMAIWDPALSSVPPHHGWNFNLITTAVPSRAMATKRWYPTCTLNGAGTKVFVTGGVEATAHNGTHDYCAWLSAGAVPGSPLYDAAHNTFEVWSIPLNDWERTVSGAVAVYSGPPPLAIPAGCLSAFGEYPRQHALSNNKLFLGGMHPSANRVLHLPPTVVAVWESSPWPVQMTSPANGNRHYGSSVLLPDVGNIVKGELVMSLGGGGGPTASPSLADSIIIHATADAPVWGQPEPMQFARQSCNAVLLPNGDVFTVGGADTDQYTDAVLDTEIYNKVTKWRSDAPLASPRSYHSVAVLLRSGRVWVGGGDIGRSRPRR